jgi:3-deoxy-D-manno-octulosonic-acid transferase
LQGDPIWIHAASVGEVRAAGTLVRALKSEAPDRLIVLSTFTSTGNRLARQTGDADRVIFLPLDFSWIVRRAVGKIHPSVLIFLETEIWPNLLREAYRRGVPTVMLSGRLSAKALSRYGLWRSFFRQVLGQYSAIGMQSEEDAARILQLGAREEKVSVVGSLKFAAEGISAAGNPSVARGDSARLIFVAGSSHRGEEEILLRALQLARSRCPDIAMVLAPRHPERFNEVEKLLKQSPFTFQRRTQAGAEQYFLKDVLLLDTLGELPEFFKAADVAFVGGSLVNSGGHNVLEPARGHKPVLFGPYMANFKTMAEEMKERGAALEVRTAEDLAGALVALITDEQARLRMGRSAAAFAAAHQETLASNLTLAKRYL